MKKFFSFSLVFIILAQLLALVVMPAKTAHAIDGEAAWQDHNTIRYNGELFHDGGTDSDEGYIRNSQRDEDCVWEIQNIRGQDHNKATLVKRENVRKPNSTDTECHSEDSDNWKPSVDEVELTLIQTQRYNDYYIWHRADKPENDYRAIKTSDTAQDSAKVFEIISEDRRENQNIDKVSKDVDTRVFTRKDDEFCIDTFEARPGATPTADKDGGATGTLYIRVSTSTLTRSGSGYILDGVAGTPSPEEAARSLYHGNKESESKYSLFASDAKFNVKNNKGDCGVIEVTNIRIGKWENARKSESDPGSDLELFRDLSGGGGGTGDIKLECSWSVNPLTWLFCPMVEAAKEIVDQLDNAITQTLTIDADKFLSDDTEEGRAFHEVWGNVRNIAMALLVIAAIVMVISQAIGGGRS